MAKKDTRIVIKDMGIRSFAKFLNSLGACNAAKAYCKGKTLKEAFTRTPKGDWIRFLLNSVHWCPHYLGGEEKVAKNFGTISQWQEIRNGAPSVWTFPTRYEGFRNLAKYYRQHYVVR